MSLKILQNLDRVLSTLPYTDFILTDQLITESLNFNLNHSVSYLQTFKQTKENKSGHVIGSYRYKEEFKIIKTEITRI